MSHTPGPWKRNVNSHSPIYAGEPPKHVFVAVAMADSDITDRERNANCNLIASAPDLLAALKLVIRDRDAGCLRQDTCDHIKTVIAKAEGRNQ